MCSFGPATIILRLPASSTIFPRGILFSCCRWCRCAASIARDGCIWARLVTAFRSPREQVAGLAVRRLQGPEPCSFSPAPGLRGGPIFQQFADRCFGRLPLCPWPARRHDAPRLKRPQVPRRDASPAGCPLSHSWIVERYRPSGGSRGQLRHRRRQAPADEKRLANMIAASLSLETRRFSSGDESA